MISELRGLMEDAPDERTRQEFQRLISKKYAIRKTPLFTEGPFLFKEFFYEILLINTL